MQIIFKYVDSIVTEISAFNKGIQIQNLCSFNKATVVQGHSSLGQHVDQKEKLHLL